MTAKTYLKLAPDAPRDTHDAGVVRRAVTALRAGDRVDLQNDVFADPDGYAGGVAPSPFEFEFAVVVSLEFETPECVVVQFDCGAFGFPADHRVEVDGEQVRALYICTAQQAEPDNVRGDSVFHVLDASGGVLAALTCSGKVAARYARRSGLSPISPAALLGLWAACDAADSARANG